MNKEQVKIIESHGQDWQLIEFQPQPRATYYTRNAKGEISEMPNLPADPYSLHHYLAKGFKLNKNDLLPQDTQGKGADKVGFTCNVCGKQVSSPLALAGHKRTHKKEKVQ